MTPNTLVERLRGIVRIPVNDGAGLLDGKDFFERSFPTSNLAREAADEIERLREALDSIRVYGNDTLTGRADGPDDREWQRDAVREMARRARVSLQEQAS